MPLSWGFPMPGDIRQAYDVRQVYSDRKSPGPPHTQLPVCRSPARAPSSALSQRGRSRARCCEGRVWRGARGEAMRTMLYPAFGHEFITVSSESRPGLPPGEAARDLFARFSTELQAHGLSLDDTVRTRLWGRDRVARDGGGGERVQILSGKARSASSSYISPRHFDSAGAV